MGRTQTKINWPGGKMRLALQIICARKFSTTVSRQALPSQLQKSSYNEEQLALQESVKKLVDEVINPEADKWEKEKIFPAHKVFKAFGGAGLLGIHRPTEYGGQGLDYKYEVAFLEALGHSNSSGVSMAIGVQTDCSTPALANFGSEKLKETFLAPALSGDMVTSIAVSEPGGGSDVASITTTAKRVGDDLVINGTKMWITKSTISKMGMHASDTTILAFEDVHVPAENIIGQVGMGFAYQMMQFQEERLAAAAGSLVPLSNVLEETINYTRERKAFGSPLINNQYLAFRLAELNTELELMRAALYQAVDQMIQGEDVTLMASMLKLKTGRLAREITDSCLQFWGGMGFTNEVRVSKLYRDLRLWSIGGGADEVMLGIICKMMDILPKASKMK